LAKISGLIILRKSYFLARIPKYHINFCIKKEKKQSGIGNRRMFEEKNNNLLGERVRNAI
jgi:hypothetical protein